MSKPDDISQEAWDAAEGVIKATVDATLELVSSGGQAPDDGVMHPLIARAITAAKAEEREACAVEADAFASKHREQRNYGDYFGAGIVIAEAIRKRDGD